jgi:hypothetical protein
LPAHSPWQTAGNSLLFNEGCPMTSLRNGRDPTAAVAAEGVRDRTPPGLGTVLLAALMLINVAGLVCALVYLVMLAVNPLDSRTSLRDATGLPSQQGLFTGSL